MASKKTPSIEKRMASLEQTVEKLANVVEKAVAPAAGKTASGQGKATRGRGKTNEPEARPMFKGSLGHEIKAPARYGRAGFFLAFPTASGNERWVKPTKARKLVENKTGVLAFAENPTKAPKGYTITKNDKGERMLTLPGDEYGWIVNERNAKHLASSPKEYKDIEGYVQHLDKYGPN